MLRRYVIPASLLLCICWRPVPEVPVFFRFYQEHGAATVDSTGTLVLHLRVDHHYPDCMAPDNFGHEMDIRFQVESVGEKVILRGAVSHNTPFGEDSLVRDVVPLNRFSPIGELDLMDPDLEKIALHDSAEGQSLFLSREDYEFYLNSLEQVHTVGEDGEIEEGGIYPATGTEIYRWKCENGE